MIDKIAEEGKIDIYNFVVQMRRERSLMVQTVVCIEWKMRSVHSTGNFFVFFFQRQYVFIYRSLLEYYLYGNTRIEANLFRSTYSNLKKNKQNLLVAEYNVRKKKKGKMIDMLENSFI